MKIYRIGQQNHTLVSVLSAIAAIVGIMLHENPRASVIVLCASRGTQLWMECAGRLFKLI